MRQDLLEKQFWLLYGFVAVSGSVVLPGVCAFLPDGAAEELKMILFALHLVIGLRR